MELKKKKITVSEAKNWYIEKKEVFYQLSKKVESIINEILIDDHIAIHAIISRAKEIDSFVKKIDNPKYTNFHQITDLAGIRIIAYVESDLNKISKVIENYFEIDPENSMDKTESLGVDKVGYRSIHYVAKLPEDRIKLPEYKKFNDLFFEVQIRTILQHSWAEIEHDKNYKFSGELPSHLKRRFKVLAGVLELADREFNSIALEIDDYSRSVNANAKKGHFDIPLDSISLNSYLQVKFSNVIEKGLVPSYSSYEKGLINELKLFGINTLKDLDNIIPADLPQKMIEYNDFEDNNFVGLIRSVLMIYDAKKYFDKCWKNDWTIISKSGMEMIIFYNKHAKSIFHHYNISTNLDSL